MKKIKSIMSIVLVLILLVATIPFSGMDTLASQVTPEIIDLAGGRINLAKNGDFEEGVINTSSQVTAKSKDGIERISVKESGGNKYLAIPARNNDDLNTSAGYNGYSFQQKFVGLETTKAYTLSFRFKTQYSKSSWAFLLGLFDNVQALGTNPVAQSWQYIKPTSVSISGAQYLTEQFCGDIMSDITTTDWITVKIVFTPKHAWTSLVIHPQVADIGELCLDDIVLTANDGYTVLNGDFENTLGDGSFDFVGGITSNANGATNKPQVVDSSICGGNGSYSLFFYCKCNNCIYKFLPLQQQCS